MIEMEVIHAFGADGALSSGAQKGLQRWWDVHVKALGVPEYQNVNFTVDDVQGLKDILASKANSADVYTKGDAEGTFAQMNHQHSLGDVLGLEEALAAKRTATDTGWKVLTPSSGYVLWVAGSYVLKYRVKDGRVEVRGKVKTTAASASGSAMPSICTLPAEACPAENVFVTLSGGTAYETGYAMDCVIYTNGTVVPYYRTGAIPSGGSITVQFSYFKD